MRTAKAEELARMFDEGEELSDYMDLSTVRRVSAPQPSTRRVALDMTDPTIARLDAFAARYGVTRQSLMKVWLVERMDEEDERAARRASVVA